MNKVAVVTGASGGIGHAVSEELRLKGYNLCLLDIDIKAVDSNSIQARKCDVTKPKEVEKAVLSAINKFGRIDVLVNAAGRSHLGTIDELMLEDLDKVYNVNAKGIFNVSKAVLPFMIRQKSGNIINICSLRGIECAKGKAAYCMSKFAARAFSKTLAIETREKGIMVTAINPGFVQTNLIRHRIEEENLKTSDLTQPSDIAKTILYLLDLSPGAYIEELNIGRLWTNK